MAEAPAGEMDERAAERRGAPDRRRRPTRLVDTLRWRGRRRGFRRVGEGRDRYVDCPSRKVIALSLATVLFSVLDGFFTLLHLQEGGREVNPIMGAVLILGIPTFIAVKTTLTGLGVFFLAIHANFRLGRLALAGVAAGYAVLIGYHLLLFAGG